MYELHQKVVHFRDGVAEITGTVVMFEKDYFVIKAERGSGEAIYVPIDTADKIIRPLMEVETADKVIAFMKEATIEFTPNTKQRRDSFKRRIGSGNPYDMGFLAKQLYLYDNQQELGMVVKFGPADLEMLKTANEILKDEFALVYNVDRDQITAFVEERIKK